MHHYNRRQFLQLTGIALVGTQLPWSLAGFESSPAVVHQGRALSAVSVYSHPTTSARAIRQLWPDSIITLIGETDAWYQTPDGYVVRAGVQPMKPYPQTDSITLPQPPFWAEVSGPAASVRQYCAANAPLVTRIGHGGVANVIDFMPDSPTPWYGLASADGTRLGWTAALHWQPVNKSDVSTEALDVMIDSRHNRLIVRENGLAVLEAPCSMGKTLHPGMYSVQERQIGGSRLQTPANLEGVPWRITFGDFDLTGVYWHNQFGEAIPGPAIQVTPLLAQWLYSGLQATSTITII